MAIRAELNRLSSLRTRMMHGLQSWPTSLWVNEICLQIITKFTNHELCEEQIYGNPNSWDHRMIIHKNKHVEPPVLAAHLAKPSFHVTTITMAHGPKCSGFRAMSHLQRRYMVAYLLVHVKLTTPTDGSVSSRKAFWWFHFVDGIEWDKSPTAWPKWLDWSVQLECDDTRPSFVLGFPMCEQSDGSHGLYKSISDLRRTYIFDWQDLRVLHLSISLRIRIYIYIYIYIYYTSNRMIENAIAKLSQRIVSILCHILRTPCWLFPQPIQFFFVPVEVAAEARSACRQARHISS